MSPYRIPSLPVSVPLSLRDRIAQAGYTVLDWYRGRECRKLGRHRWVVTRRWVFGDDLWPYGVDDFGWDGVCEVCRAKAETYAPVETAIRVLMEKEGHSCLEDPKIPHPKRLAEWQSIPQRRRAEYIRHAIESDPNYKRSQGGRCFPRRAWKGFGIVEEHTPFGEVSYPVQRTANHNPSPTVKPKTIRIVRSLFLVLPVVVAVWLSPFDLGKLLYMAWNKVDLGLLPIALALGFVGIRLARNRTLT